MSNIYTFQPGPRKAFMAARLEKLNGPTTLAADVPAAPRTTVTIEQKPRRRYTKKGPSK